MERAHQGTSQNTHHRRTRMFALTLDNELQIAKISKGYINTAFNEQLTVTITSETLKNVSAHEVHTDIVGTSFRRSQEFEITQIRKPYKDSIAYLIATLPEQRQKSLLHQVAIGSELITTKAIFQQSWTKKEIAKKNINIAYTQSEVTEAFKKMIGEKSMVCTFFPRGNNAKDQHDGICNLEVANPIVYKQYLCKTAKMLHMHVKFTPHPRSLDGTSPPSEASLKEFGFFEVNTAIANAFNVITNGETAKANPDPAVTLSQVQSLIS
jgi:hypothetical protein